MAVWTDLPFILHTPFATGAQWQILQGLKERLLLELAVVGLGQRFTWTEQNVEQQTDGTRNQHEQRGEDPREDVASAGMDIA